MTKRYFALATLIFPLIGSLLAIPPSERSDSPACGLTWGTQASQVPELASRLTRSGPELIERQLKFQKKQYAYTIFAPNGRDHSRALPVLLLLHGAGGNGSEVLSAWQDFARNNEIILIAPNLPLDPVFEPIAPQFFRAVVDDVAADWSIDPHRAYVFGHSMGGYLAFDAAAFDSDSFAAVAVHASFIAPDYVGIVEHVKRKIPIALYIGERDLAVPLNRVRATKELLLSRGFPLHYVEIPGHDHDYYAVSKKLNRDIWDFLRKQRLP
ncbi:MAG TPA: alpha/beta fold hydrolase [Blastocatellia bacterium]|nr:alpha/beta fold hydrolase [Blastocatellia bacterium]